MLPTHSELYSSKYNCCNMQGSIYLGDTSKARNTPGCQEIHEILLPVILRPRCIVTWQANVVKSEFIAAGSIKGKAWVMSCEGKYKRRPKERECCSLRNQITLPRHHFAKYTFDYTKESLCSPSVSQ